MTPDEKRIAREMHFDRGMAPVEVARSLGRDLSCIGLRLARGSWLVAPLVARGLWLVARGSWLLAPGSRLRLAARGSRLAAEMRQAIKTGHYSQRVNDCS